MSQNTYGKRCRLFGVALRKKFLMSELKRNMKISISIVQGLHQLVVLLRVTNASLKKVVASLLFGGFFNGYEQ